MKLLRKFYEEVKNQSPKDSSIEFIEYLEDKDFSTALKYLFAIVKVAYEQDHSRDPLSLLGDFFNNPLYQYNGVSLVALFTADKQDDFLNFMATKEAL